MEKLKQLREAKNRNAKPTVNKRAQKTEVDLCPEKRGDRKFVK